MKLYIIITEDISPIGGMQLYTAGKTKFLEANGWDTIVFHPGIKGRPCAYSSLNRFSRYSNPFLKYPPYMYKRQRTQCILDNMLRCIKKEYDQVYIESQHDVSAYWAELIAEKTNGIHICFNCNEIFRGSNKYYEEGIEFFEFKYQRRELLGLRPDTVCRIFEGHFNVQEDNALMFDAVEPNPIQDVEDERIKKIGESDYTIMYLGRIVKGYVPSIIEGVKKFAQNHRNNSVQFVVVGDISDRKQEVLDIERQCENIRLVLMGNMVPIPRKLYEYVDVVIAGAVCAEASAREGVPTIVADCENYLANGVLGYTTKNSMYHEGQHDQSTYDEALEDVLIKKDYCKEKYSFPPSVPENEIYESHFCFFEKSEKARKYYNVLEIRTSECDKEIWKTRLKYYCPQVACALLKVKNG